MSELCTVEVVEHYQDAEGKRRGRWRAQQARVELTAQEATKLAHELRATHGGARVACKAFEVVALRQSLALKLIEPGAEPVVFL